MPEDYKKKPNRLKARSIASKLLKECDIDSPPVRVGTVTKHLDIFVDKSLTDFLDKIGTSALIELEDKIIEYNDKHPVVRKRFSIAHEIGHLLMGHSVRSDIFNINSTDPREIEANIFAAELLMPFDWLKKDLKQGTTIPDLAWKYWVSVEAMGWRIAKSDRLLLG